MSGTFLVRDIMTKAPKVVGMTTGMQAVVNMMVEFDISSIIIVQGKTPVGIITHKDIVLKLAKPALMPNALQAKEVMTSPVITIDEEATMEEAAMLMEKKHIKKLVVVKNEELTGIITSTDLIREHPKVVRLLQSVCSSPLS